MNQIKHSFFWKNTILPDFAAPHKDGNQKIRKINLVEPYLYGNLLVSFCGLENNYLSASTERYS
jgi:hypothetical protein